MPQYLSTDPNAGQDAPKYLSTDPNAGNASFSAPPPNPNQLVRGTGSTGGETARVLDAAMNSTFPYIHPYDAAMTATEGLPRAHQVVRNAGQMGDILGTMGLLDTGGAAAEAAPGAIEHVGEFFSHPEEMGNAIARFVRDPATEAQSLRGKPGSIKVVPKKLNEWMVPDWIAPKGELGTPTNPGPFRSFLQRSAPRPEIAGPELGSPENPGWVVNLPNRMPEKTPQFGSPENPGWVVNLPNRMPRTPEPEPELGSPDNPGWFSKIPNRMPALPAVQPELGTPENPGWLAPLPNRMPVKPETMPEIGSPENPGFYAKLPTRMPKIGSPTNPNITVEGVPGIGASGVEREMQTISDPSRVITPSEFQRLKSVMGKDAYPRPGESQFDYRKRITGGWKAARARTETSP